MFGHSALASTLSNMATRGGTRYFHRPHARGYRLPFLRSRTLALSLYQHKELGKYKLGPNVKTSSAQGKCPCRPPCLTRARTPHRACGSLAGPSPPTALSTASCATPSQPPACRPMPSQPPACWSISGPAWATGPTCCGGGWPRPSTVGL